MPHTSGPCSHHTPSYKLKQTPVLTLHTELPGKTELGGKVERENEREEFKSRGPLLLSGDAPAHP